MAVRTGLREQGAIVGIGELPARAEPDGASPIALMSRAGEEAVRDAGLAMEEVDGLLVAPPFDYIGTLMLPGFLADALGLTVRYAGVVDLGGASACGMVWRAVSAIQAGLCRAVLCLTGDVQDPRRFYQYNIPLDPSDAEFVHPYGPMFTNSWFALMAQRHMHDYGTTPAQLAKIAVDQRRSALLNPSALYHDRPLTVEDVLNSRLVSDPLHLLEIVRPCTYASAVLVVGRDLAPRCPHPPVWLLGAGEVVMPTPLTLRRPLTETPVVESASQAFAMAGLGPREVDLVSVYDCYTINVLMTLEDAGFCEKGRGGPFVEEHDLSWAGDFPVNTHGGQLSYGQAGLAGGMTHITEAVRQLQGRAGPRQVKGCRVAFVNGTGGIIAKEVSLVLGVT